MQREVAQSGLSFFAVILERAKRTKDPRILPMPPQTSGAPTVQSHRMVMAQSVCIAATLLCLTLAAHAQSPEAAALAKRVDAHYNHLQSLQARFTERYQGMGLDRSETGTLTLRKPGRMKWAYDAPSGKLFVLDGKNAISYTPGDAQALRTPAKQLDDLRSPLRFLLGHTELAKELTHLTLTPTSDGYTLSGTPIGMAQTVRTISLTVDATGQIRSMRIEQIDGSVTSFAFTAIQENIPVKESDFLFIPPNGVTIINGSAPL